MAVSTRPGAPVVNSSIWTRFYFAFPATFVYALICVGILAARDWVFTHNPNALMHMVRSPMWAHFDPSDCRDYLKLVTHIFGHQDWLHLKRNLIFLLPIGMQVEIHYRAGVVIALGLFTAAVTGVMNLLLVGVPIIGASGIVFLFIALSCYADRDAQRVPLDGLAVAFLFIAFELYNMMSEDRVSQLSHLLGAAVGVIYGWWLQRHPDFIPNHTKDALGAAHHHSGDIIGDRSTDG